MLPRLQREDNVDQFASNAIPIQLLQLLKQCLLGMRNGRPFEIGAIGDMRRSASYGLPLKKIAERSEGNEHGKVYEQRYARTAEKDDNRSSLGGYESVGSEGDISGGC